MAKKQSVSRIDSIYSRSKDSLDKYYKREFSTTKANRVVVWEKDGYSMMADDNRTEKNAIHK